MKAGSTSEVSYELSCCSSLFLCIYLCTEFQLYKWLRNTALDKLSFSSSSHVDDTTTVAAEDGWKERKDAENALDSYLNDLPSTL